jgi:NTE family protein
MSEQPVDLVFEGGGVKGIGLAGAFSTLYEQGYRPRCVAGTSAGAITGALVAAGYTGEELKSLVLEDMHFPLFADQPRLHSLGALGDVIDVLKDRGLHSGEYFLGWMREKLEAKGVHTFGDLPGEAAQENVAREFRLQVIASDLTTHSMLILPRDAEHLGAEPGELSVAEAVRMSMSIPVFFDPVLYPNGKAAHQHMIVDGGMLSNYPIWLFDATKGIAPRFPTFGMLLVAPNQEDPLLPQPPQVALPHDGMLSPLSYVKAIADTMMEAHDRLYVEQANYARTIPIPTCGVTTTEFDISANKAQQLFDSGRTAAAKFLGTWDFEAYLAKFRKQQPPSRRATII